MTDKEHETYYSTHLIKDGRPACGHRLAQYATLKRALVTCPWCLHTVVAQ